MRFQPTTALNWIRRPPYGTDRDANNSSFPLRHDIDGLRGIAILAVVAFHGFPATVPAGFVGVDVFFAISGFLITSIILGSLAAGGFSLRHFYERRVNRLFPALAVMLLSSLAAGWFLCVPPQFKQLGAHVVGGGLFASNVLLWDEVGYFDAAAQLKPLLHLWSLSIEEQFYVLWPALLLTLYRQKFGIVAVGGCLCLGSLALNLWQVSDHPQATFYLLHTRLWELLLGGLLALLTHCFPTTMVGPSWRGPINLLVSAAGLTMIAAAMGRFDPTASYPGWRAVIPVLGTLLVIAGGAECWVNRTLLSNAPLVFVGRISYPLYLWHWPILAFARLLHPDPISNFTMAAVLLGCAALAWVTYRYLELPIRRAQRGGHARSISLALLLLMAVVMGFGYTVFQADGITGRYPKSVQALVNFQYDHQAAYRSRECFIDRIEDVDRARDFSPLCVDAPTGNETQPVVVLWGDSMAAHLYPGLRAQQSSHNFRIAQFTTASCPPVIGFKSNAVCAEVNVSTARRIASIAPSTVLMAGLSWTPDDIVEIGSTVKFLKDAGAQKIVIVGPTPRWADALPRLLYRQYKADVHGQIPAFLASGWQGTNRDMDLRWKDLAMRLKIDFVSALDALCDQRGCVTMIGNDNEQLTAWDTIHLTTAGSELLIDRIFASLSITAPSQHFVPAR